jgi:prepilin-type N-terminal cleavage/methylation domain-containing protein
MKRVQQARTRAREQAGFSLVELLLSLSLGLVLSGLVMQALMGEGQNAQRFTRLLRERNHQRRALALIRADLERATAVVSQDEGPLPVSCGLNGRTPVLQLRTTMASGDGIVTYSVGAPPSGIWEGRVLVRCGPAYGLEGGVKPDAAFQSRVVLDRLAEYPTVWSGCTTLAGGVVLNGSASLPLSACLDSASQLVALRLQQSLPLSGGKVQRLSSEVVAGAG